jgi:hypothetical protein
VTLDSNVATRLEGYEHRLNNAQAQVADAASAWCWDGNSDTEVALRDAVAEWRTALGLYRLAARRTVADDHDRSAERRYESWLESLKDHGP